MSSRLITLSALLAVAIGAGSAIAAPANAPPMNASNSAYYICSGGKDAFVISYSAPKFDSATITTNTQVNYALQKSPVSAGFRFGNKAGVEFWTDGKRVSLTGMKQPYTDCQLN